MRIDERYLVVVSGPSGCGKDTVVKELMRIRANTALSVSCTTRAMREDEVPGESYYFVSREEFLQRVGNHRMLEYTEYAGNFYGTPLDELEQKLGDHQTVILVIEVNGAKRVKELYPGSLLVFIVPPSLEELERRLRLRNTETDVERGRRIEIAQRELRQLAAYDVVLENDIVADCARKLCRTIDNWQSN